MLPPKLVREVGKADALKRASKEQQEKQHKRQREKERELRVCQRGVVNEGAAIKIKRKNRNENASSMPQIVYTLQSCQRKLKF